VKPQKWIKYRQTLHRNLANVGSRVQKNGSFRFHAFFILVEFKHVTGISLLFQVEVATFERLQTRFTANEQQTSLPIKDNFTRPCSSL